MDSAADLHGRNATLLKETAKGMEGESKNPRLFIYTYI